LLLIRTMCDGGWSGGRRRFWGSWIGNTRASSWRA